MAQRLAVAVIHGMGSQKKAPDDSSATRTFSAGLHGRLIAQLGAAWMADVAWREIYWADVVQAREDAFIGRLNLGSVWQFPRRFVMHRLSDAALYRVSRDPRHRIYQDIHARVATVLDELRAEVGPDAPLVLIAHSLGGHILSNFIWDAMSAGETGFSGMETMRSLVTFGCNIPVFVVGYDESALDAIAPPVAQAHRPGDPPWWLNYWDRHDALGFPLAPLGGGYGRLAGAGQLADHRVTAGLGLPLLAHAFAHNGYWTDAEVTSGIAGALRRAAG
ncbi:hypothetical protein SAMN04490244_106283 [Tranquillimonas rosea]|uniref:Alpha/beta hydrolase family protein n=1 Tax=Tranquillimonas rosea TaxID=641238 RepID=A0A1H9V6B3_9RHOB|nr:hypothetical protein [Tranquillimonas rosea]SES17296.1 hypothetical protein SAMN04490244_106283 [Tranquillimonas rosea]